MSIHIGLVPLSQNSNDVFTIYSSKSNLMRIQSPSNDVFMDIGDYNLGQRSNEPFVFSYKNSNIIEFDSDQISLNRNIVATNNLNIVGSLNISSEINTPLGISCSNLDTSNIVLHNNLSNGYKFIDCHSNNINTLYVTNEDKGVGYIGGRLGIGVETFDKQYSLMTSSNIYVNGNITGDSVITHQIFINSNTVKGGIYFNDSELTINASKVTVNNLVLGGKTAFSNLECNNFADISGLLLASNVIIGNNDLQRNPFKINQRLIANEYGNNTYGNPISVKSQHLNIAVDPSIMELSSCGNLILGDYPSLSNLPQGYSIIKDYVIRGHIPSEREQHFKGYLSFSSNGSVKTSFNVDKSGQVSIGTSEPSAILDIVNGFTSNEKNYVKPNSIIYLRNGNTSNELPFLKCENSNSRKFQITSNATLSFTETPVDMYKYNIESDNNYLSNIDTCRISSYYSNGIIDMASSILSNISSVFSCNIATSNLNASNVYSENTIINNCFIDNLEVGSFATAGFGNQNAFGIFLIGSDHLYAAGKNIVISKDIALVRNLPSYANKDTDKLIIQTETSSVNANGYTIFGNNKSIKLFCKNENTAANSYVIQEFNNSTGGFAILSRLKTVGLPPELYITALNTSGDPYALPAVTLYNDKSINFAYNVFVQTDKDFIGVTGAKSLNVGDGILIYAKAAGDISNKYLCLTTNKYGSIDTGKGISSSAEAGPFNKQGGWTTANGTGVYIILNADYGVKDNTSGTLYIQVKGATKLGNAAVSFLRFTGTSEIFTISRHKSALLTTFSITAVPSGIQITTDSDCKICWTSIGSC